MRHMYGCPENFREFLTMPTATFPDIFNWLMFRLSLLMCVQNLNIAALAVPKIIGGNRKNGQSLDKSTLPFLQNFNGNLFGWTLRIYGPNLKYVAFPVPEIIMDTQKIGQSLDTPTLPFLQFFSWAFIRMDPLNVLAKFEIRSFSRS